MRAWAEASQLYVYFAAPADEEQARMGMTKRPCTPEKTGNSDHCKRRGAVFGRRALRPRRGFLIASDVAAADHIQK